MTEQSLYCVVDWDDGYWNDIPVSCIKEPRKAYGEYLIGERVRALLPSSGIFRGVIAAIDEDRDWLRVAAKGPRPIPTRAPLNPEKKENGGNGAVKRKSKDSPSLLQPESHGDEDSESSDSDEIEQSLPEKVEKNKQKNKQFLEESGIFSLKKTTSDSSSSMKRGIKRKLCEEDKEAKKEDNKKKRERSTAREETLSRATEALLKEATPEKPAALSLPISTNYHEDILSMSRKVDFMAKKVDECLHAIRGIRSCRQCAKKLLRSFDAPQPLSSPTNLTSFSTHSDFSIFPCSLCDKLFNSRVALTLHVTSEHEIVPKAKATMDVEESRETDNIKEEKTGLSYVGEARFGVQMDTISLHRCQLAAKSANKLALNLIEFLISPSEIRTGISVYGNIQYKLRPMPDNLVLALKSHIFDKFPTEQDSWKDIVKSLNKKLQNIRNGKYISTL